MSRVGTRVFLVGVVVIATLSARPFTRNTYALENKVVIESHTAEESNPVVLLNVDVEHRIPINGVILPLIVRTVEGDAFWNASDCGQLLCYCEGFVPETFFALTDWLTEPLCDSVTGCVNGLSPDQVLLWVFDWWFVEHPPSTRDDFITLILSHNANAGRFVIDTCSFPGERGTLSFTDLDGLHYPAFTPGEICVNPAGWGDMTDDGTHDIADIVALIDHFFRHAPPPPNGRADYNCDARTNLVDVVRLIDTLLRDQRAPCCPWGAP